jgi:hypothetical protein
MSHICANDEYRSQVDAAKSTGSSRRFQFSFTDFPTGLSLRSRADISKVTAHERIQHGNMSISVISKFSLSN